MSQSWNLIGYQTRYFAGDHDAARTLKNVRRFIKAQGEEFEISNISFNYDVELGWSAEVTYYGEAV